VDASGKPLGEQAMTYIKVLVPVPPYATTDAVVADEIDLRVRWAMDLGVIDSWREDPAHELTLAQLLADGFVWTEHTAPDLWLDDNAPLWLDDQPGDRPALVLRETVEGWLEGAFGTLAYTPDWKVVILDAHR
jgi:hypothetical protein